MFFHCGKDLLKKTFFKEKMSKIFKSFNDFTLLYTTIYFKTIFHSTRKINIKIFFCIILYRIQTQFSKLLLMKTNGFD